MTKNLHINYWNESRKFAQNWPEIQTSMDTLAKFRYTVFSIKKKTFLPQIELQVMLVLHACLTTLIKNRKSMAWKQCIHTFGLKLGYFLISSIKLTLTLTFEHFHDLHSLGNKSYQSSLFSNFWGIFQNLLLKPTLLNSPNKMKSDHWLLGE